MKMVVDPYFKNYCIEVNGTRDFGAPNHTQCLGVSIWESELRSQITDYNANVTAQIHWQN